MINRLIDKYIIETRLNLESNPKLLKEIQKKVQSNEEFNLHDLEPCGDIAIILHPKIANCLDPSRLHTHNCFELVYVHSGNCHQHFANHGIELSEGEFCLLNMNIRHGIAIDDDSSIIFNILIDKQILAKSFFFLLADNDVLSSFFMNSTYNAKNHEQYIYFEQNTSSNARLFIEKLICEYFQNSPGCHGAIQAYLSLTFTELLRNHVFHIESISSKELLFSSVMAYVNEHLNTVTLQELAAHFHYHPNYLSNLFRLHTAKTFSCVVNDLKFFKATAYLKETDMPINHLVDMLGFYDRSYFNREFKKRYGVSPKEYRNQWIH